MEELVNEYYDRVSLKIPEIVTISKHVCVRVYPLSSLVILFHPRTFLD